MNQKVRAIFKALLSQDKQVHIKLLGDSITHGVGGTGFEQDGEPIVEEFARNPNGYCWANMFKSYMEEHYNCTVTNNACTGTRIEFILRNFETLVDEEDDLIICMIGTNNRHQAVWDKTVYTPSEFVEKFYQNIKILYQKLQDAGKTVIFMANIPASEANENEQRKVFHMEDVHNLYAKASLECGFAFVSLYQLFYAYLTEQGLKVEEFLEDTLHPNDAGYEVMYSLLMEEFGIDKENRRNNMYTKHKWNSEKYFNFNYVKYLPKDFDPEKKYPLVFFLHGAGERGEDLDIAMRHGYMQKVRDEGAEYPFIFIGPQCPHTKYWACYTESLIAFLEDMIVTLPVDEDRVYLTGLSMGGAGTWMLAMACPEKFAALAPVCGSGMVWNGHVLKDIPIMVYHGDQDAIVPLQESVNMVSRINGHGGDAQLKICHHVAHEAWDVAYNGDELWKWLLSKRRNAKEE